MITNYAPHQQPELAAKKIAAAAATAVANATTTRATMIQMMQKIHNDSNEKNKNSKVITSSPPGVSLIAFDPPLILTGPENPFTYIDVKWHVVDSKDGVTPLPKPEWLEFGAPPNMRRVVVHPTNQNGGEGVIRPDTLLAGNYVYVNASETLSPNIVKFTKSNPLPTDVAAAKSLLNLWSNPDDDGENVSDVQEQTALQAQPVRKQDERTLSRWYI